MKTLLILVGVIILLASALHIYIINNAEKLIENIVSDQSNNKLRLKLEKIKFNYFSRKIVLENAAFYSNDLPDAKTSYSFVIKRVNLQVKALIPVFTKKELDIDSLFLLSPEITVTKLRSADTTATNKPVSISEEMGKIYNSIMDALTFLKLTRFELDNGKFKLIDKTEPQLKPLEITNLNFHIDNFRVDTTEQKFFSSDQLVFKTHDQDIRFPDGKHRLAFSKFRINIRKRLIEIDSCTLTGRKPGNDRARFSVFFDTVKLINVDFNALYKKELIKADSIYCRNPNLKIDIQLKEPQAGKKRLPDIDTLIQQLTGDMMLGYIGVSNATLNINTYQGDVPTNFSSDKNNFEMHGLVIDHSKPEPVSLSGFSMAIHNYRTFLKDSSYILRFDSILLRENRLLLSNFSINTEPYKDTRNIKVRLFGLSGLSWGDLLFNKKIIATQATLFTPVIDYNQPPVPRKRKKSFLSSLQGINNIMSLEKIAVVDGQIKIKTRDNVSVLLENTDFTINSSNIELSSSAINAEQAVDSFSFNKGVIKFRDIIIDINKARYNGDMNNLIAEKITLYNRGQTFNVIAKDVRLNSVKFNDTTGHISATTVNWKQAQLEINDMEDKSENVQSNLTLNLENIQGNNTQVNLNKKNSSLSAFLNNLSASKITYNNNLTVQDLKTEGNNLSYSTPVSELVVDAFKLQDRSDSRLNSLHYKHTKQSNTLEINIPQLSFIPEVAALLKNKIDLRSLKVNNPHIYIQTNEKIADRKPLPDLSIDRAEIVQPVLKMDNPISAGLRSLNWNSQNNTLIVANIQAGKEENRITIGSVNSSFANFSFTNNKEKTFSSKEALLTTDARDIILKPGEKLFWQGLIKRMDLKNLSVDSFGKKPTFIKLMEGSINDLLLGSELLANLKEFAGKNTTYSLGDLSGYARNEKNNWSWKNISYSKTENNLSLDSFSISPVLEQEAFTASHPFQTDYMTFKVGKINMNGFDPGRYFIDSILHVHTLSISDPYFTSFRDKRPPFKEGVIKPLPSKLIQRIPFKLGVDTIKIANGTVIYTELNDKTKDTAIVPVTQISGDILPIKNYNISNTDTFRIRLNGYLLDSAWIRLRTRESYADSLSGFQITVRMRPRSLLYLNSMLSSLAAVRLKSGYLDTLTMRAIANDYYSLGEMRMFYRNLKVEFFVSRNETKKNFLTSLKTFIANSFIIKNKNTKRTGVVYFARIRDKSFINYYIKTFTSGIVSAVGAKNAKKMYRRHQKELKQRNLPTADSDL